MKKNRYVKRILRNAIKHIDNFGDVWAEFGLKNAFSLFKSKILSEEKFKLLIEDRVFWMNYDDSSVNHVINSTKKLKKMVDAIPVDGVDVVFDIGANCGLFSFYARERFQNAKIFSFEPSNTLYELLVNNIKGGNSYTIPKAVSNENGKIAFYINKYSQQTNSIDIKNVEAFLDKSRQDIIETRVDCITLDTFLEENQIDKIDVLKIDVQGAEPLVFDGGKVALSKTSYLLVELSFLDSSVIDQFDLLRKHFNYWEIINPVAYGADILFSKSLK